MSDDKPIVEIGETYLLPQGTTKYTGNKTE